MYRVTERIAQGRVEHPFSRGIRVFEKEMKPLLQKPATVAGRLNGNQPVTACLLHRPSFDVQKKRGQTLGLESQVTPTECGDGGAGSNSGQGRNPPTASRGSRIIGPHIDEGDRRGQPVAPPPVARPPPARPRAHRPAAAGNARNERAAPDREFAFTELIGLHGPIRLLWENAITVLLTIWYVFSTSYQEATHV